MLLWYQLLQRLKQNSLYALITFLVVGSVFGIGTYGRAQGWFGNAATGGSSNAPIGNAGHTSRQPANVAGENLKAYYPFDGNAADRVLSTSTKDLTPTSTSQGVGKRGSAANFASNSRLTASSTSVHSFASTDFTIAGWVYLTTTGLPTFVSKYAADYPSQASDRQYYIGVTGANKLQYSIYNTGGTATTLVSANTFPTNQWAHVIIDYNATTKLMQAYVSTTSLASPESTTFVGTVSTGTTSTFEIGGYVACGSCGWRGNIDEVGVWNRLLSDDEKAELFNGGSGRGYTDLTPALRKNLQSWYTLDEASGTRADSVKVGNDGTVSGATATTGKFGQAYGFNGTNNSITIPDSSVLDPQNTETGNGFTVSTWYKGTGASQFKPILVKTSGAAGWVLFAGNDCKSGTAGTAICFRVGSASTSVAITSSTTYADTNWHHIVAVMTPLGSGSRPDLYLYIDGVLVGRSASPTIGTFSSGCGCGTVDTSSPLYVGYDGASNYLNGTVDDVRIYNDDLTATQAAQLYGGSNPPNCDQTCVGWWKNDDTTMTSGMVNSAVQTSNSLTNQGTTLATGRIGNGIDIESSDPDWAEITDTASNDTLDMSSVDGFTVTAWFKPESNSGTTQIVGKTSSNVTFYNEDAYSIFDVSGTSVRAFVSNGSSSTTQLDATITLTTGQWYFVALRYVDSTNTVDLFVGNQDGTTAATASNTSHTGDPANNSQPFMIGRDGNSGGRYFDGVVDEVGVWRRNLTGTMSATTASLTGEIQSLYNSGSGKALTSLTGAEQAMLVAYWSMEDAGGATLADGWGNKAAIVGAAASEGIYGGGLSLTGSASSYIDAGTADALNLTSNYFTISAWVKFNSTAGTQWLVARDQVGSRGFAWGFISGKQTYSVAGSGSSGLGSTLSAGTWYHVVITSERPSLTTNKFYLNGALDATSTGASAVPNVIGVSTSIGERKYSGFEQAFNGTIDDVRIYNRTLSANEVAELYRAGASN